MKVEDCFQLGHISKPHGINGELILVIDSDHPEAYENLESVFVDIKQKLVPFFIEKIRLNGNRAQIKFDGIDEIEEAESLKGKEVYLPLSQLPELSEDQYYYHEIIGFSVTDKTKGTIGEVINIYEANGNDLLVVNYRGHEVLIPLQDEVVIEVDKARKMVSVDLPAGLLEIYLNP